MSTARPQALAERRARSIACLERRLLDEVDVAVVALVGRRASEIFGADEAILGDFELCVQTRSTVWPPGA